MLYLSWDDVRYRAKAIVRRTRFSNNECIYGVPRGGIYAALLLQDALLEVNGFSSRIVDTPHEATVFVDDLIDSGATRHKFVSGSENKPFFALVDKPTEAIFDWVAFPWEVASYESGPEDSIVRLLQYIGEDPKREGLLETPKRVIKSYSEIFGGYKQNVKDFMKAFTDGACDEMVVLREIEFTSCCEHHMLPFTGVAHVGYIPNGRVIGVSKLARLVDMYAKRLQIQERICQQVTSALDTELQPKGSACVIEAKHMCMTCRGVGKQNSVMVTSSLTGQFMDHAEVRGEFMSLIRGNR